MIEISSSPTDLTTWKPDQQPFYLEVYGETSPLVDEALAEVVAADGSDPKSTADAPVYEYWWTLGHPGAAAEHRHWYEPKAGALPPWLDLQETAARIYLYFPASAGWRINEVTASLKYLSPAKDQRAWLKQAAQGLKDLDPIIGDASTVAALIPGGATASKWLQAVSKLQLSSLPQNDTFNWSVGKVTFASATGLMQGVMWTLPKQVFECLGGRITGSLAVSFTPARQQSTAGPTHAESPYRPADVLAHAVVYGSNGNNHWTPQEPEGHEFVHLSLLPRSPKAAAGDPVKH